MLPRIAQTQKVYEIAYVDNIKSLDVLKTASTSLTSVFISQCANLNNCNLTVFHTTNFLSLSSLTIQFSNLKTVKFSAQRSLKFLSLKGNDLASLSGLSQLKLSTLDISMNNIADLSQL